jgi:AcrR family transcriptional regulator
LAAKTGRPAKNESEEDVRERILRSAMEAFMEHGFAAATMLEIATRAKVSKRELYALVGNKEEMLASCVARRGQRMRLREGFPEPTDAASLRSALREYGTTLLGELMDPDVLGVFRLGVAESTRSPGVAASIVEFGRKPARAALESMLRSARTAKLLRDGDPAAMVAHYQGLLWGDLMVWVLLGTAPVPTAKEIRLRADEAARCFLVLFGRDV